jgi:NAD(P)-dependent dehydrogenase (short-subunit alcohol dehydrogenase family)
MARVFVTGSADGLGLAAGQRLRAAGHDVVLHARSDARASSVDGPVLVGDLSSIAQTRALAEAANESGRFDAVIHNAGIGYTAARRITTGDGLEQHFQVNVLAPYLLTALMTTPDRLIYLSSGMHQGGHPVLDDPQWERRRWSGSSAYSDTKLWDVVLAFGVARRLPSVLSNAVDPGWIATRMGGRGAPGGLDEGTRTQIWLATSDDPAARVSGRYFSAMRARPAMAATASAELQDGLLDYCATLTGVSLPA